MSESNTNYIKPNWYNNCNDFFFNEEDWKDIPGEDYLKVTLQIDYDNHHGCYCSEADEKDFETDSVIKVTILPIRDLNGEEWDFSSESFEYPNSMHYCFAMIRVRLIQVDKIENGISDVIFPMN